jgi:hypothetical protein
MPKVKISLDQPRAIMGTAYKPGQLLLEGRCPIPVTEDKLRLALLTSRLTIQVVDDTETEVNEEGPKAKRKWREK